MCKRTGKATRRQHDHIQCQNQTPVAAMTRAAMAELELPLLSTATPRTFMDCLGERHLPPSNVILSLPPSMRTTSKEAALNGIQYSAAARTDPRAARGL